MEIQDIIMNVKQRFNEFKDDMLKKTNNEIFNECFKINFFKEINTYFMNLTEFEVEVLGKKYCKCLHSIASKGYSIIDTLFEYFIKYEDLSISNYNDIRYLIRFYCERQTLSCRIE